MSFKINNTAILNILGVDYCCIVVGVSKREMRNQLKKMQIWVKIVNHYKIYTFLCIYFTLFLVTKINENKIYYEQN